MQIVEPKELTEAGLVSTNVSNEYSDWVADTYNLGDRVVYERTVYEVVADPSTTDRPDEGAAKVSPTWLKLGWCNQWRMFTEGQDSLSTSTGDITTHVTYTSSISTLAVLGVVGSSVTLTVTDSVDGVVYNQTIDLVNIGAATWWEWYFLEYEFEKSVVFYGIPPYPGADVEITITGASPSDPVAAGRVVAGNAKEIGVTQYGTSIDIIDYSTKERDGFGNLILVPRRAINIVNFDVTVDSSMADYVVKQLKKLSGKPALYIGSDIYKATIVYGIQTDVSEGISTVSVTDLTLQVEEF